MGTKEATQILIDRKDFEHLLNCMHRLLEIAPKPIGDDERTDRQIIKAAYGGARALLEEE